MCSKREHVAIHDLKVKNITQCSCEYLCPSHRHAVHIHYYPCHQSNIQQCASFFSPSAEGSFHMLPSVLRSTDTITKTKKVPHSHIIYMSSVIETMWMTGTKHFFPWQIMFTSKFKNTHPHLEEMPSRFSSVSRMGTSVANTVEHVVSSLSAALSPLRSAGALPADPRPLRFTLAQMHEGQICCK